MKACTFSNVFCLKVKKNTIHLQLKEAVFGHYATSIPWVTICILKDNSYVLCYLLASCTNTNGQKCNHVAQHTCVTTYTYHNAL